MIKFNLKVKPERTLHIWVKSNSVNSTPFLTINSPSKRESLCFQIINVPQFYQFYSYQHFADETVEVQVDLTHCDVSLAYMYDPKVVEADGVTFMDFHDDNVKLIDNQGCIKNSIHDDLKPDFHFTPYKGWMNDPNGLCFYQGKYHLFYQYYPNGLDWGPMHWGHAVSENLTDWRHLPIFLHPEQNLESLGATGGAFSGTAFHDQKTNELGFFFTERKPAYDLTHSYCEVQKRVYWDQNHCHALNCQTIIDTQPNFVQHDFRDPKVWFDLNDNLYKMILGSAVGQTPAILLYCSQDKESWEYHSILYQAPNYFEKNKGRCIECPDFIQFGDVWVVIFGVVGYHEPNSGRHNLLYAVVGKFEDNEFKSLRQPQCLDFGTDFYAMQSFNDGDRQLAFAWLHNWATNEHVHSEYNGEMSVPRVLSLTDELDLTMLPASEVKEKFKEIHPFNGEELILKKHRQRVFSLHLKPQSKAFIIRMRGESTTIEVIFDGQAIQMVEKNNSGSKLQYEWRSCGTKAKFSMETETLHDIQILFDHGIVELFSNGGRVCGTRRYINTLKCYSVLAEGKFSQGKICFMQ